MRIDRQPLARPSAKKPPRQRKGPREKLAEALLSLANGKAHILSHSEKSWASITFAGARHRVELEFAGAEAVEAGECFIVFLPEHEFAIPGQLVADAAITQVDHTLEPQRMVVTVEILVLEEG
ncbi:hypothetical protein [Aurantiacibacter marinus]|uniref:Uncharacterized protein n=1 Tax=Aurantiacibacter marinus TaxID=874156 RepID=A0A0H0XKN9_9SPHN|nr:hypothetical protein [Aurantiacibacter marinus]KLI63188.1 hypothetical protein AAV99_10930 [Aurantiacibacter marinus]